MKFGPRAWLGAAIMLAWLPLAIGVAYPSVYQWSRTAGSNDSADPSINWREGMAPSAVNDSARAMMAALASWRDDTSGVLATGGTSTAYTVTTNQVLPSTPTDGQLLAITPNVTNGVAPTLQADGGTVYPIQSSPGVAVAAASLVQGTSYTLKFSNSNNAWILRDFYGSPFIVPLGAMIPYTATSAPNANFVIPAGQCISRTTYSTYFALVGTAFGGCDGSTTFAVPDMRGRVAAGLDNMGGFGNVGRLSAACSSATNGATCGAPQVTLGTSNLPAYTPSGSVSTPTLTDPVAYANTSVVTGSGGLGIAPLLANNVNATTFVDVGSHNAGSISTPVFSGSAQGGSSTPFNSIPPTLITAYILRVL